MRQFNFILKHISAAVFSLRVVVVLWNSYCVLIPYNMAARCRQSETQALSYCRVKSKTLLPNRTEGSIIKLTQNRHILKKKTF